MNGNCAHIILCEKVYSCLALLLTRVNKDSFKSSELGFFTPGNANKFVLSCLQKTSFVQKEIVLLLPFAGGWR